MAKKFEKDPDNDGRGIAAKVCMMRNKNHEWFWHGKGYNGEITCAAEGFSSKAACYHSAAGHAMQMRVPLLIEVCE